MSKSSIMEAVENLSIVLNKVDDFEDLTVDLSDRIRENRIITLEGYLKFLDSVGIPRLKEEYEKLEVDAGDRSDIL